MRTKPGPRSRKPSKPHSPPIMQQCKLELPSLCSTKTGKTPQDSTNTSPPSPSSLSVPESLITIPYQNGSSEDSTHKLWYNSLSQEQSKPPPLWRNFTQRPLKLREVTTVLHHSGEDPNHSMEEVAIIMTPMLWMWITSCYSQSSKLTTCAKIAVSYAIKKAVLLGIILVTIRITQQVVGATTWNHPRLSMLGSSPSLPIWFLPPHQDNPLDTFLKDITKTQDVIRYYVPWNLPLTHPWMNKVLRIMVFILLNFHFITIVLDSSHDLLSCDSWWCYSYYASYFSSYSSLIRARYAIG